MNALLATYLLTVLQACPDYVDRKCIVWIIASYGLRAKFVPRTANGSTWQPSLKHTDIWRLMLEQFLFWPPLHSPCEKIVRMRIKRRFCLSVVGSRARIFTMYYCAFGKSVQATDVLATCTTESTSMEKRAIGLIISYICIIRYKKIRVFRNIQECTQTRTNQYDHAGPGGRSTLATIL